MLTETEISSPKAYYKKYNRFRGVDMSSAVTEVDESRSPDAPNMIADNEGFPQKRCGFKILAKLGGRINGIYSLEYTGGTYIIVHAGTYLYRLLASANIYGTADVIYSAMADSLSSGFVWDKCLYLLDGTHYLKCDGTNTIDVATIAYVPTTMIASPPTGGGTDLDAVNLLSNKRINCFAGTATATTYQLDTDNITSVYLIEKLTTSGTWSTIANTAYSVNTTKGQVTFTTAPGVSPIEGDDNIKIYFNKNVSGYAERIKNCTINTFYGLGNDTRIFLSGNKNYRNQDWFCGNVGQPDPAYFPDNNNSVIGTDATSVMGYMRQYGKLVIVKEYSDKNSCIFLRDASLNSDNDIQFSVEEGLAGIGAISKRGFGTLLDDNLFLSERGVFGLDTSSVTLQKTTQLRSMYVNEPLTKEESLDYAFAVVHDGYYMLFVNDRVYVANSRQRNENVSKSFGYEWFYWTDVSACAGMSLGKRLYIGDNDGNLRLMKTLLSDDMQAYSDEKEVVSGTPVQSAICSAWTTKMDTLSDASSFKNIKKRNTGVLTKPFAAGSGKIYYITDSETFVKEWSMTTTFDFDNVDFNNFNFGMLPNPTFIPCNRKMRKTRMLGIKVENNTANESFGAFEIQVAYTLGNAIKNL